MESIKGRITGTNPLLVNNPQTVDPLNPYMVAMKKFTGNKAKKTEESYREKNRIECESRLYFDDALKVYVPSDWVLASLCGVGFKMKKISKAMIRSAVFPTEPKLKLYYEGMERVKGIRDISTSDEFRKLLLLKQGQVKVPKCSPIFNNWHFDFEIEFDPSVLDRVDIVEMFDQAARYGGFGDFRPSYGRAVFSEI